MMKSPLRLKSPSSNWIANFPTCTPAAAGSTLASSATQQIRRAKKGVLVRMYLRNSQTRLDGSHDCFQGSSFHCSPAQDPRELAAAVHDRAFPLQESRPRNDRKRRRRQIADVFGRSAKRGVTGPIGGRRGKRAGAGEQLARERLIRTAQGDRLITRGCFHKTVRRARENDRKRAGPKMCDRAQRCVGPVRDERSRLFRIGDVQRERFFNAAAFRGKNRCDGAIVLSRGADAVDCLGREDDRSALLNACGRFCDERLICKLSGVANPHAPVPGWEGPRTCFRKVQSTCPAFVNNSFSSASCWPLPQRRLR